MFDRYTKAVLTVIAAALVVSTAQQLVGRADAQPGSCGTHLQSPCVVALATRADKYSDFVLCDLKFPCMIVHDVQ